ncbi:MAG TPA: aspartyl/asparaginyl beta-hydroxylase domain-containing protein [Candidatus Limnocylindria bacterium]|nr:aspartyl/asparaginyl beta-hydroxylase domain-containing protein [Candidatus Limnocylindria bacterium]
MPLAEHVRLGGALLGSWVGAATYVHFRGRERLAFMRQLTDHSTLLAPYNTFVYLTSAVPNTPILRVEDFPELATLREHWTTIRDEAVALLEAGAIRKPSTHNDLAFDSFYKRDWRRFYLKWYGDWLPSAKRLCPRTIALLERTPSVHAAMFTVLAPRSHLVRHRDPFAGSLRYHLGLVTPNSEQCRIFVDGQPYVWRDGEAVLFDETYVHRAENKTDTPRIILFCDVERPLRHRAATAINRFVIRNVMGATATSNVDGERIGVANRIFERLYTVRDAMLRLKKRSRRTYYALSYGAKLAAVGGLLYLALF